MVQTIEALTNPPDSCTRRADIEAFVTVTGWLRVRVLAGYPRIATGNRQERGTNMSRPIKISNELYERLKDQADEQGLTLQDALVELITAPHEGLGRLQAELETHKSKAASVATAQRSQASQMEQLRAEASRLRQRVEQLYTLRAQDNEVWREWVEVWNEIDPLAARVNDLERLSHRHTWQVVDSE